MSFFDNFTVTIFMDDILCYGQHGDAVFRAAASQQEGPGFDPWLRTFQC